MKNRDVSIAVSGVVVGLILGAFSAGIVTSTDASVIRRRGDRYVPFLNAPNAEEYTRRRIDERGVRIYNDAGNKNAYPTLREAGEGETETLEALDMSPCGMVRRAVGHVHAAYEKNVPNTLKNTQLRKAMDAAFDEALMECTEAEWETDSEDASGSADHGAAAEVDNDCEKYGRYTVRYTMCVISEDNGIVYP